MSLTWSDSDRFRMLASVLQATLKQSHPHLATPGADLALTRDSRLDADDLGVDSIELMEAASAVNRVFHLYEVGIEDNLLRDRALGHWADLLGEAWPDAPRTLSFLTSGTTGEPKPIPHPWATLCAEAEAWASLLPQVDRVVALAPPHHLYGFIWTVLLPKALGVPVVDLRDLSPSRLSWELSSGDLIVSHPFYWKMLVDAGVSFPGQARGVTSTEACPTSLWESLRHAGLRQLWEIYGASETGGVGYRDAADARFRLLPTWSRLAHDGDVHLVREGHTPILPQDHLVWEADGEHFDLAGRRDDAVQVAGINVYPEHVASILSGHPNVREARVEAIGEGPGDRLRAILILDEDTVLTAEATSRLLNDLDHWMRERLSAPERPGQIVLAGRVD